jgi:hypothetical protein
MIKHRYVRFFRFLALFLVLAVSVASPLGNVQAETPEDDPEMVLMDSTPPAFEEPPYQMTSEEGTRHIEVYINPEGSAYYHLVLLPDGAAPPSKEQVKAGTDGDGNPALDSINSKDLTTGTNTTLYAVTHSTDYDVYVVLEDDAKNLSEPAKVDVTSPKGADYIKGDGLRWLKGEQGSRQILIDVYLQNIKPEYKGKVYWVLLPMGAEPPSIDQIASGTDGEGNPAISMGSPEFSPSEISGQFVATGAAGDTNYDLYLVVGNTESYYPLSKCTEVQQLSVTTPPDIPDEKVCEMKGIQYGTLEEALDEVEAGTTATIKLLKSFTSIETLTINKKHITFDLNGHVLNIHTASDEGLKVTEGTVALEGDGELNASGRLYGVSASLGSKVTVTNAVATNTDASISATSIGVLALSGSKVTVRGNATGTTHGIRAENIYTEVTVEGDVSNNAQGKGAVHCAGQAEVLVKGNVTAPLGYGVSSYSGKITVNKNVYGSHVGAYAEGVNPEIHIKGDLGSGNNGAVMYSSNGVIIVDGEIKGSATRPSPAVSYVSFGSTILQKEDGVVDPAMPGYLKYSTSGASAVWVKDPMAASIWEVYNALELEDALDNFKDGDIIRLKADIEYDKSIVIDGKSVTFDLGNYDLNVIIADPSVATNALWVKNSGHVYLDGTGQFNISLIGDNTSTGVRVEAGSSATVTNIRVTVLDGSAFGAYADGNNADIHVLGDIYVFGLGGCGARTWARGKITVEGTITASNYINIGTVNKSKESGVDDPDKPGYLKYSTPPNETGIVWVKIEADEPEYTVTVQNDGNGTAAADMNAAIPGTEITLTATANEGYRFKEWQVVSGGVTITDNRFTMPTSDVVVKAIFEEIPAPAFTVTVNNGTGTGSYPPGATVTITADEAADGWVFDKWVSDDGVAFADASEATTTFVMPDKNVTITATYKQEDKDDPGDDQKDDQDDEKDDPTDVPKTGDTGSPWVWLLLGGISVVSMSLLILMRKRKKYSV